MRSLTLLVAALAACSAAAPPAPPSSPVPARAAAGKHPPAEQACGAGPTAIGRIENSELNEISGVLESRRNPGVFFVHNDSGDSPRLFAIDRQGQLLAELALETVPLLIDAEDIAIGPAPEGRWFLYLGDVGNNFASMGVGIPRRKAVLHRFAEPEVSLRARDARVAVRDSSPITFTFPDGARDVEAFVVDPLSGDLVMIGKQGDGHSQILSAPAAMLAAGGGELHLEHELVFGRGDLPGSPMPTAASISRDGLSILIRTYSSTFLFRRREGESVATALRRAPRVLPTAKEQQGEAVGFAEHDTAFLTISEGVQPPIHCTRLPQSDG